MNYRRIYVQMSGLLKLNAEKCYEMTYTANLCNSSNTDYHIENCNTCYHLAKVDSIIDLGVRFDSKLAFVDHIIEKVKPTVFWVSLKEILYIWIQTPLFYFIRLW